MNYWKGLMLAAAIDAVWIMGCPILASEPGFDALVTETVWVANQEPEPAAAIPAVIMDASRLEDSLMTHLQQHPDDVTAMEKLAQVYMENAWYEAALRPLARALQIDPTRRSLWVALDRAIEKSGRETITDAELTQKAIEFKDAVEMWGMGC